MTQRVYFVLYKLTKNDELWQLDFAGRGGLDVIAWTNKRDADRRARVLRSYHEPGCVKVQPAEVNVL